MQVTAAIKARVEKKLKDGIALAEKKYNQTFAMPKVTYDLRGRTAGTANYNRWHIRLNAVLLMENVEDFLERTVPHELAHLITDRVYPEAHHNRGLQFLSTGRVKRGKRDVHGAKWQSVCLVLGMTDITRCHQYDVTNSQVVKSNGRSIEWQCACGEILKLTPKKSAKLDANPGCLWHRGCRGAKLTRVVPTTAKVDLTQYGAVMHNSLPKPVATVPTAPAYSGTKLDQCKALYLKYSMLSRAEIIAKFVAAAGCTPAGAGTYYATCKKVYG